MCVHSAAAFICVQAFVSLIVCVLAAPAPAVTVTTIAPMFSRLFGTSKKPASGSGSSGAQPVVSAAATQGTVATMDRLSETLDMLDKKERKLQKDIAHELARAKEFTLAKNKVCVLLSCLSSI